MVDVEQAKTKEDEIVFSARYSTFRVWAVLILIYGPFMPIFFLIGHFSISRGEYVGILSYLLCAAGSLIALDSVFFKEILFFQNKIVKVWYLFGERTIYYLQASL